MNDCIGLEELGKRMKNDYEQNIFSIDKNDLKL